MDGQGAGSPVVSGIVALMLQVKGDLDPQYVKDIISQTAITDAFTGAIPPGGDNTWGAGKINAYGSVKQLVTIVAGINTVSHGTIDCSLFPNPGNGLFYIDYTGHKTENVLVSVYDELGRNVHREKWLTNSGNNFKQIDLKKLNSGIYFVNISSSASSSKIKT